MLSADKTYEYEFRRVWNPNALLALWIMRNPSKIDNLEPGDVPVPADGKTVARCADFSRREGWGGLVTWNVFAYRGGTVGDLSGCDDPVGPENDAVLHQLIEEAVESRIVV